MKEPLPAKDKLAPAPREITGRPASPVTEVRVAARFYRRMKPQRVFPLVVELQGGLGGVGVAPVFVRPFIPGALVTPAEQTLDPSAPGSTAVFHVTPVAKGTLREARLEIFQHGRLIQEMPLRMRAVTQRLTWVLAALTVLVPAFLLYTTVYHKLQGVGFATRAIPLNAAPGEPEKLNQPPKEEGAPRKDGANADGDDNEAEADLLASMLLENGGRSEQQSGGSQKPRSGRGSAPPSGPAPPDVRHQTIQFPLNPGETLEREINRHVPSKISLKEADPLEAPSETNQAVEFQLPFVSSIAWGLGEGYNLMCNMAEGHLSFWAGVVLLGLTVASGITHRRARARKRSKPLLLTGGGHQPPHG